MNGQRIDIGTVFGTYTVIGTEKDNKNKTQYILRCDCGYECKKIGYYVRLNRKCMKCGLKKTIGTKNEKAKFLKYIGDKKFEILCDCGKLYIGRDRSKSCGCHMQEYYLKDAKSLEGTIHNNIKILKFSHFEKRKVNNLRCAVYHAKCKCGNLFQINRGHLKNVKTCGCRIFSNHAKGQNQYCSTHSNTQMQASIDLYLTGGYSKEDICTMTGISIHTLKDVINNKSWKHLQVDKKILDKSPLKSTFRNPKKIPKITSGQQFNSWIAIRKSISKHRRAYWLCKCKCGHESEVPASCLRNGESKQCANCALIYFTKRQYLNPNSL